ncbi:MAG TPA: hypothetical protein VNA57_06565 [Acidimicrobiales bacterium]|nr:hypothetical protein [Acidimicrobiales bacterium]
MPARVAPLLLAAATVLALSGGSCSSDKSNGDDPTLPTTRQPTPTTTTTPEDPYAIPKVIDEAYVNRVLAALDQIDGDALREVVSKGAVTFESVERIRAIYNDPEYEQQSDGLRDVVKDLGRFRNPPGNRKTTVLRLPHVNTTCIVTNVTADFGQVVISPPTTEPGEFQLLILERTQSGADPKRLNPTSWSIRHDEVLREGQRQDERCD